MNTNLYTILNWILSAVIIIFPLAVFAYTGKWLRTWYVKKRQAKYPGETPEKSKRIAVWIAVSIVVIILILLFGIYFLAQISNRAKKPSVYTLPKIDTHEHLGPDGSLSSFLVAMAAARIEKMVLLPIKAENHAEYKKNEELLADARKKFPEKFITFTAARLKNSDAAELVENSVKNGAGGIKIDWSPKTKKTIDSPASYKIYEVAGKYGVPVLAHANISRNPEWAAQFERAASAFPEITFILSNYCGVSDDKLNGLAACAKILDKFPNVYADISMGNNFNRYARALDRDTETIRNFLIKYQDKIIWGADIINNGKPLENGKIKNAAWVFKRVLSDFTMLEFTNYRKPLRLNDTKFHTGLNLPDDVLKKIYHENPRKIFKL